jgi:hypothetical protein
VLAHGRALWAVALLLFVPAAFATLRLYLNLSSDVEELLPRDAPSVRAVDELRARLPGLSTLGVVVDAGSAQGLAAAERLIDDLAARVRAYPPSLVRAVRVGTEDERRFLDRHGALYVDLDDLREVRRQVAARKGWETKRALSILLEDEPPPPIDLGAIRAKYDARYPALAGAQASRDRFSDPSTGVAVMLIEGTDSTAGAKGARQLLARVRADLQRLGGPRRYAPGMRVGFAGNVAVSVEELAALSEDLGISTVLVVSAVLGVILLYFGWWVAIPALVIPLLIATVLAFALAAALPLGIDRLNSSTAFLGSIVVGNGINFGIIWLARYAENRRRGVAVEAALREAVWGARPGTLVAALAAATSYASLVVTRFRGFRQFGIIGGIGMVLCWVATYVLSPPLLAWIERRAARDRWPPRPLSASLARRAPPGGFLAAIVDRGAALIAVVAVVLTAIALVELRRFDSSQIESDFSRLRRHDTWRSGEGYWGRKMDAVLKRNLSPTVILTDRAEEADAIAAALRAASGQPPLGGLVAQIRSARDALPADQPQKIAEIQRLRRLVTPTMKAAMAPADLAQLERFLAVGTGEGEGEAQGSPALLVRAQDLPPALAAGLRERDGSFGRTVLVYPYLTKTLWQADRLTAFVAGLRATAAGAVPPGSRPGRVAGYLPLAADITQALRRDGPIASAAALAAVAILVVGIFFARAAALWVLGSLLLGVLWMLGFTLLAGVKINYVNFVAFPITFGIGVDYAVNIMARYRQELARAAPAAGGNGGNMARPAQRIEALKLAIGATGGAVALCSLTTSLGYSSLLLAKNRGLFKFGVVAVAGEVSCLSTAVVVLPAVLLLALSARAARQRATEKA